MKLRAVGIVDLVAPMRNDQGDHGRMKRDEAACGASPIQSPLCSSIDIIRRRCIRKIRAFDRDRLDLAQGFRQCCTVLAAKRETI
jgi:hypothetical protein